MERLDYNRVACIKKVYWGLHRKVYRDVTEALKDTMEWDGHLMNPTPDGWFKVPRTYGLTDSSLGAMKYLTKFKPYLVETTTNNGYAPTKLLCIRTGVVVPGNSHRYFTVSHVWSSSNFTMVDGILSKGSKGYSWLERMSRLLRISHAWIDVCCVDECSKQYEISRMRDYYRNANACAVLLHSSREDVDDLVGDMKLLSAGSELFARPAHAWILAHICCSKVLSDKWFTRIWTIQEAMLSSTIVVDSSCGLTNLKELLQFYDIIVRKIGSTPMSMYGMRNAEMLSRSIGSPNINMSTVLELCAGRDVTYPQDYVYGILGMLPGISMSVDYHIPVQQLAITLYEKLVEYGDTSWFPWVGPSCVGRGVYSWIPAIGSHMIFVRQSCETSHSVMDVSIIGKSSCDDIYHTRFQPIVTLDDLSIGTGKCSACIAAILCNLQCCRPWMVVKFAKEVLEVIHICDECLAQEPDSADEYECRKHISHIFRKVHGSHLVLVRSGLDEHILVLTIISDKPFPYGEFVRTVTGDENARVVVSENFGWLFISDTMERIGVVVTCARGMMLDF